MTQRARMGSTLTKVGRAVASGWRSLRNPDGWYDEIDDVYGRVPAPRAAADAAAIGAGVLGNAGSGC